MAGSVFTFQASVKRHKFRNEVIGKEVERKGNIGYGQGKIVEVEINVEMKKNELSALCFRQLYKRFN